ncbi:M4A8 protein, partial [Atractosteus spatula]|nr:M4A8 protein [Atractosteus spatula]
MASSVTTDNGTVIVTQVYPQSQGSLPAGVPNSSSLSAPLQKFLNGEPKALGAVQITVGLLSIFSGVVMTQENGFFALLTGIPFWGGLMFIASGALSVAAEKKLSFPLLRASLSMNITSTITAGFGIIIYSLDLVLFYHSYSRVSTCVVLSVLHSAIKGILLVFTILEFAITISTSAFTCNAVCYDNSAPIVVVQHMTNAQPKVQDSGNTPYKTLENQVESAEAKPSHPPEYTE